MDWYACLSPDGLALVGHERGNNELDGVLINLDAPRVKCPDRAGLASQNPGLGGAENCDHESLHVKMQPRLF